MQENGQANQRLSSSMGPIFVKAKNSDQVNDERAKIQAFNPTYNAGELIDFAVHVSLNVCAVWLKLR